MNRRKSRLRRRAAPNNDTAHTELKGDIKTVESDVKKLLAGDVAWVRALLERRQ